MGSPPPKPKQPQKTLKQIVAQNIKQINKMRRQFQRQCYKLQSTDKKLNKDLKKQIKDNASVQNKKQIAQNILKNQKFIVKYKNLDAQLQNTTFQLQQMGTMQAMQKVMTGLANIMGSANGKIKIQQFQKSMTTYQTQKQKMELINQMIQDGMDFQDQIDDTDVDQLISNMQNDVQKKKMQQAEQNMEGDQVQNQ